MHQRIHHVPDVAVGVEAFRSTFIEQAAEKGMRLMHFDDTPAVVEHFLPDLGHAVQAHEAKSLATVNRLDEMTHDLILERRSGSQHPGANREHGDSTALSPSLRNTCCCCAKRWMVRVPEGSRTR